MSRSYQTHMQSIGTHLDEEKQRTIEAANTLYTSKTRLHQAITTLNGLVNITENDLTAALNLKECIKTNFETHCFPEIYRALTQSHSVEEINLYAEVIEQNNQLLQTTLTGISYQTELKGEAEYNYSHAVLASELKPEDIHEVKDKTIYLYKQKGHEFYSYTVIDPQNPEETIKDIVIPGLNEEKIKVSDFMSKIVIPFAAKQGHLTPTAPPTPPSLDFSVFGSLLTNIAKIDAGPSSGSLARKLIGGFLIIAGAIALGYALGPAILFTFPAIKTGAVAAVSYLGIGPALTSIGTFLSSLGSTYVGAKVVYAAGMLGSLLAQSAVITAAGGYLGIKVGKAVYANASTPIEVSKKEMAKGLGTFYEKMHTEAKEQKEKRNVTDSSPPPRYE